MNKIITDNDTLMRYVPNVMAAVKGEKNLFEKISTQLLQSELCLCYEILGDEIYNKIDITDNSTISAATATIVVSDAMMHAIPTLDLILTPNGYGIVSNSNVAPASKERVERLISEMESRRDDAIELLLAELNTLPTWRETTQGIFFNSTVWNNLDFVTAVEIKEHRFKRYKELRQKAITIENDIADEYLSFELLEEIHDNKHPELADRLKSILVFAITEGKLLDRQLTELVNIVRNDSTKYAVWFTSEVGKRYLYPEVFVNKKKSTGYFF